MHWNTISVNQLLALYNSESTIWVASDGSHDPDSDYGSFGVSIGGSQETLMQVRGHAPGSSGLKSLFRSELYGILAVCVLVAEVTKYCECRNITDHTLQIYLDSTSVIDRIQTHWTRPIHIGEVLAADMDVELQVIEELKLLSTLGYNVLPIKHVKSHQD